MIIPNFSSPKRKFFEKGGIFLKTVGIVCEYNPFHLGHKKQIDTIRAVIGPDAGIVCLMSGNYVQRGMPAVIDKSLRAKAAVLCGADLVLELPLTASLSSAEGFAAKGVSLLNGWCDALCFGAENPEVNSLLLTAQALLSEEFPAALRTELDKGKSFPAARANALEGLGLDSTVLSSPNNILAVEYCKAILLQNSSMTPLPIKREGSYHDKTADSDNPSATAVRNLMLSGEDWTPFIPSPVRDVFDGAVRHSLSAGERAVLARLRTMTEAEFEALPYGSEGLWRKLMHAVHKKPTLEAIAAATKSKRYTRTRIDRMIMCGFLGLTARDMNAPVPYARALAFNNKGREILKSARNHGNFPNIGEKMDHPYQAMENRADALYGLFSLGSPTHKEKQKIFVL